MLHGMLRSVNDFTGIVLAGGASSRMGRDKTGLRLGGRTLLEIALAAVERAGGRTLVIGPPRPAGTIGGALQVDDAPLGNPAGPLRALCCGLPIAGGTAIVLACDVPLLPWRLIRALLEALPGFDAVVPESGGRPHVLTAAYGPGALRAGLEARALGEASVRALLPRLKVRRLAESELLPFGGPDVLLNVNTPGDLARAAAWLEAHETAP